MTPLAAAIADRIRRHGPITVAEYMELCLADPRHGYYRRARPVGAAGDFVTAPEISQMFGELLGLWAAEVWAAMGGPAPLRLVELGPGRGTLMADALRAVGKTVPAFRQAIDLHLVEINPHLRALQDSVLADARPAWHERLEDVPDGPSIVLANEFFDALPARQFVRSAGGWRERCVGLDAAGRLAFVEGPAVADPPLEPAHRGAAAGAIVEVSPAMRRLAAALARRIAAQGGAALVIDYGPMASGAGETLQSLRRHRRVDPLAAPGESDLTVHVDFMALARAAAAAGADVYGPVPQGTFLHRLGIAARAAILMRAAGRTGARSIVQACERLIGGAGMGTLFKALAMVAPGMAAPPGFDPVPFRDHDRHESRC